MKNSIFIWIVSILLVGCGNQGGTLTLTMESQTPDSASGGNTSKPILSLWTDSDSGFYQVDLRSARFDASSTMTVNIITGGVCTCSVLIRGSESSGAINISSCSGNSSYCTSFNISSGNYTKSSSNLLEVCDNSGTSCIHLQ
jgi:hypothetical protein